MPGGLLNNFREGNRSELLADYLLSSIGITTPVRRQDDHGFDFYCQISDQESGYLTFGFPFVIQIKSDAKGILYGATASDKWKIENLSWLFRNELPFFIGIVNKERISIDIYDTTGLWQVYNQPSLACSQIELTPIDHNDAEMRNNCEIAKIEHWDSEKGDGNKYTVDLGNSIIRITY